jgi:ABC-type glycerol-3-phosphate transport system permease component
MTAVAESPGLLSRRDAKLKTSRMMIYALLILGTVVFVLPFLWMVSTALKQSQEVFTFPPTFWPSSLQWRNFIDGWTVLPFGRFLLNTLLITTLAVLGNMASCILPAYAFARLEARGKRVAFALMLATMMIPIEVTLVPLFVAFSKLNMVNTFWPLILPAWFGYAYFIFLLRQFFMTLPREYDEAARIDGAGYFRTLWSVVLPQARPAIATVAIFAFVGNWNNLLAPIIYLRSQDKFTLVLGLQLFQGQYQTYYNQMMAVALITLLPILLIFLLAQRTFIEGANLSGIGGR